MIDHPYHSAKCERTEACVDCGAAIEATKCRCGYWITRCPKCSHEHSTARAKKWVEEEVKRMRADFNKRMREKYG